MRTVTERFARCEFRHPFRRYQQLALDAVEADRASGDTRAYVVMPPGAGKTVVGLEAARRLGRRTLVLVPNTAVQGQWLDCWNRDFAGADAGVPCGSDRELSTPLTVLTYQSLAVLERTEQENGVDRRAQRRSAIRGGDREALLGLLHPNGRELVARAAALGPWTLVLDECHHLLETWGALVRALVEELGSHTAVVALTATPARQFTAWQKELHDELFGPADFEVPTPALVKDGDLAPYQELAYLTAPTVEEDTWLASERQRFADLQVDLVDQRAGEISLVEWLSRRLGRGSDGQAVSWSAFALVEPALARAGLRFAHAGIVAAPDDARLREEHRVPPDADDWAAVLGDFCLRRLEQSDDPADADALAAIRRVLPSLGYRLTTQGLRSTVSPVDRLCELSAAKTSAAVHVLSVEDAARGDDLRAVVLCDFEVRTAAVPARLADTLDEESGSARLAFQTLAGADVGGVGRLRPLLVTGRTLGVPVEVADDFVRYAAERGWEVRAEPWEAGLTRIVGGWSPRRRTRIATEYFAAGRTRVLVGTRALLGEGWDCAAVNVTVDLTAATTPTAMTQMRGRSLRLDPDRPDKVANNWTVSCVTADHPRGDADYLRLVRKHDAHLAPTAIGEIESGVSHCDPRLSPFGPPAVADFAAITAEAMARAVDRDGVRERWRLGQPYVGAEAATVRIRSDRALGMAPDGLPAGALVPRDSTRRPRRTAAIGLSAAAAAAGAGIGVAAAAGAVASLAAGVGAALLLVAAVVGVPALRRSRRLAAAVPSGALERLAFAVADGLHAAGGVSAGAAAVRLVSTSDGWLRCVLEGVPASESALFAGSLDELLAPLSDPRHLVGRVAVVPPSAPRARLGFAVRLGFGLPVEATVGWHAVPAWIASGARRRREFLAAWERHVGPARHLTASSPEGQAILELHLGADPFDVTTQLRTIWR